MKIFLNEANGIEEIATTGTIDIQIPPRKEIPPLRESLIQPKDKGFVCELSNNQSYRDLYLALRRDNSPLRRF